MRSPTPLVLVSLAALIGCGGSLETASDGRILVTVSSRGAEPQSSEYLLTLNGARPVSVTPNGSAVYDEVPEGTHVVHLFSLADNCVVSGSPTHRSVEMDEGKVVEVTFAVLCSEPVTGGFRILVSTVGTPVDDDGYQLSVAGTPLRTIPITSEERYEGLTSGVHLVALKDVADFCEVDGGNPQPYTVVPGKAVQVAIRVRCGPGGPLQS